MTWPLLQVCVGNFDLISSNYELNIAKYRSPIMNDMPPNIQLKTSEFLIKESKKILRNFKNAKDEQETAKYKKQLESIRRRMVIEKQMVDKKIQDTF